MKPNSKNKNYSNQCIKCDVMDCKHNLNDECICGLETIEVCTCTDCDKAQSTDGTACNSYDCKC